MVKNGRAAGCLDGIGEVSWMDEWLIDQDLINP